jgi:3-hydroxyacyl-CoA dehydrogenase
MIVTVTNEGNIACVTIDNPPVNAVGHAVRQGLINAIKVTEADDAVKAVVLIGAGRTFVSGADVREFDQPPIEPHLPDVISALEAATKPWIAAIHGAALGGGLEIALGCSHRIAYMSAKLGLPEVNLGLIPGAGGTVRLPRLVDPGEALVMIAGGKPISAMKARDIGLIDQLVDTDLRDAALEFAHRAAVEPLRQPLSNRKPQPVADAKGFAEQSAQIRKKTLGQKAPLAAISAVQKALSKSAEAALAAERETFLSLKSDPQCAALRHIFFAERASSKFLAAGEAVPKSLQKIGIVGGGTMGAGIATACLLAGLNVTLIERNKDALEAGIARINSTLASSLKRRIISPGDHQKMKRALTGDTIYSALGDANVVIEAVFEDINVKREVFAALDAACKSDAILATNTSYLDVGKIAQVVANPSRVIGLHFFSPAHIMKLLELIIPVDASLMAVATGAALGKRLRKIVVHAGVCDGFIGNRIMSRYRRECDYMLVDGAAPDQIDRAMRKFGFPMGIYQMQDLAGLDIAWAMRKRQASKRDPAERYVSVADKLCEAGRFGRKTGQGWYDYSKGDPVIDDIVTSLIQREAEEAGISRESFSDAQIVERILRVMQDEGHAVLKEGIAARSGDIDVVMVNGYGFPRWRGGPMFMAAYGEKRTRTDLSE